MWYVVCVLYLRRNHQLTGDYSYQEDVRPTSELAWTQPVHREQPGKRKGGREKGGEGRRAHRGGHLRLFYLDSIK